jgi:hypothetical protein
MKLSYVTGTRILGVALLGGLWAVGCSSSSNPIAAGGAAATTTGGTSSTSTAAAGGSTGTTTGGSSAAETGGSPAAATGGSPAAETGGSPAAATGGATASVGGSPGTGGATSNVACPGCLVLYVPLSLQNTGTDVEIDFGATTYKDMSTAVVTAHVLVQTASNAGGVRLYAKNDTNVAYASLYSTWQNLTAVTGWQDLTLDLSAVAAVPTPNTANAFDKSQVRWLGINVAAGATFTGAVFGNTTVYVDTITISNGVVPDFTFATTVQGFAINIYNTPITGSTVTWVNQ